MVSLLDPRHNCRIHIKGIGSIHLKINGYIIKLHDVFYVPDLQYSLYLIKQHKRYQNCSCLFYNDAATLSFPNFNINIHDDHDILIYATSLRHKASKIHWSSMDGIHSSGYQISNHTIPHKLPYQKPNPSKQSQRKISNIDIHNYMGF